MEAKLINKVEDFKLLTEKVPYLSIGDFAAALQDLYEMKVQMEEFVSNKENNSQGIASNQLFRNPLPIITYRIKNEITTLINPVVEIMPSDKGFLEETCLSLPGIYTMTRRNTKIKVKAWKYNPTGRLWEATFIVKGFESFVIQHEVDHLDGITILDRADSSQSMTEYNKLADQYKEVEGKDVVGIYKVLDTTHNFHHSGRDFYISGHDAKFFFSQQPVDSFVVPFTNKSFVGWYEK